MAGTGCGGSLGRSGWQHPEEQCQVGYGVPGIVPKPIWREVTGEFEKPKVKWVKQKCCGPFGHCSPARGWVEHLEALDSSGAKQMQWLKLSPLMGQLSCFALHSDRAVVLCSLAKHSWDTMCCGDHQNVRDFSFSWLLRPNQLSCDPLPSVLFSFPVAFLTSPLGFIFSVGVHSLVLKAEITGWDSLNIFLTKSELHAA